MERQCPCYRFAVVDLSGEVYEGGFFLYAFQVRYLNQPLVYERRNVYGFTLLPIP